MKKIGLAQSTTRLFRFLRPVQNGASIAVIDRNREITQILPVADRPGTRLIIFWLAIAFCSPTLAEAPDSLYRDIPASPDGIGKVYDGREIAHVMGFQGAPWLDRQSREHEERPDLLVQELHLTKGMTIADVGAGSGYLSRRLAPLVSPGLLFAVDVQPQMVEMLRGLAQEPGMGNIVPLQSTADDVNLAAASVDLAIMVDVYHELASPFEVMKSLVKALRPGGRVVFVEYRGEDPKVPIRALHKMTEAQVRLEMQPFPLEWERTSERLPLQHIIVFRKR